MRVTYRSGDLVRILFLQTGTRRFLFFFFNDTATTEIYTLSLHDALPISQRPRRSSPPSAAWPSTARCQTRGAVRRARAPDRKSTRLNSSHSQISYAVFCLKKKNRAATRLRRPRVGP